MEEAGTEAVVNKPEVVLLRLLPYEDDSSLNRNLGVTNSFPTNQE